MTKMMRAQDFLLGEPRNVASALGSMTVQEMIDGSLWITRITPAADSEIDWVALIQSLADAANREFRRGAGLSSRAA